MKSGLWEIKNMEETMSQKNSIISAMIIAVALLVMVLLVWVRAGQFIEVKNQEVYTKALAACAEAARSAPD